ncbi:MAG TPA: dolichyl-phosphate beta-glucosyltransferase [Candidatus Paceibacterota bacterium]|nr:dolichyl-phosphate beta-glucosyltransferase [Candidatus Paceibacterota bacterium]
MHLSVIIPAKNEEKIIRKTVESVFAHCSGRGWEHEIIVVANNSTDTTASVVKECAVSMSSVRLIEYHGHPGKGYAVRTGMLGARGDFRLFMDADNSTTIDNVDAMLPFFKEGYDVVIASIAIEGSTVASGSEPIWRRLFGKLGNLWIQIFAVPGIWDTQRGFKVVTANAAEDIFSVAKIDGWGFDVEMLALARKFKHRIKEVPIHWKNDGSQTKVGLSAYVQVLKDTLRVRWYLLTRAYSRHA